MKKETRNELIFLAAIIAMIALVYKNSPVLQSENKKYFK